MASCFGSMDAARRCLQARATDLLVVQDYVAHMVRERSLPAKGLESSVIATLFGTLLLSNLLIVMLNSRGRKLVLDTIETILAVILIVVLLTIVLGLPLAIVYLVLRGIAFGLNLILGLPVLVSLGKQLGLV